MTTTARIAQLRRDWPTLPDDVKAAVIRHNVAIYWRLRRLARRERGAK